MNWVVFEKVDQVVDSHEGIVDGHDSDVRISDCCSENKSPDAAKPVDTKS